MTVPAHDQQAAMIARLRAENARLRGQVEQLLRRIMQLNQDKEA